MRWGRSIVAMDLDLSLRKFSAPDDPVGNFLLAEIKHGNARPSRGCGMSIWQLDRLLRAGDPDVLEYGGAHLLRFPSLKRKEVIDDETEVVVNETFSISMNKLRTIWMNESQMNVTASGMKIKPFEWGSK